MPTQALSTVIKPHAAGTEARPGLQRPARPSSSTNRIAAGAWAWVMGTAVTADS